MCLGGEFGVAGGEDVDDRQAEAAPQRFRIFAEASHGVGTCDGGR